MRRLIWALLLLSGVVVGYGSAFAELGGRCDRSQHAE